MKKIILSVVSITIVFTLFAQTPQAFKYQTVVRDATGEIIASQAVSFRISIHEGSATGTIVYQETHEVSTNDFGLAILEIGIGIPIIGLFTDIDWGTNSKFLEIELGPPGGFYYDPMGTSQIHSVPYALYAENSGIADDNDWIRSGNYLTTISDSVGIGTVLPSSKLDVAGTISQSGTGWSIWLGKDAGAVDDGSNNANVFIGDYAGYSNIEGEHNIFIGYASGVNNHGSNNTYIGWQSGFSSSAMNNTFLGSNSGYVNQIGSDNVFIGESSGYNSIAGNDNTFLGYKSGFENFTGNENVCIGKNTNQYNQDGINNTILGSWAGAGTSEHNKSGNIFLGYKAGFFEIGDNKLYIENSDADSSNALIYGEFDNDLLAFNARVGIGTTNPGAALEVAGHIWQSNIGESVFVGYEAGSSDDGSDNQNVFIGHQTGYANTTGGRNTFIGYRSGYSMTESNYNTFVGRQSGYNSVNTTSNTFIGNNSGYNNISGEGNTFLGESSGVNNLSGNGNVFIGYKSGQKNTTAKDNINIGVYANFNNQEGMNNTIVGSKAGYGTSEHNKSGNIFIGYEAGYFEQGNNKLYIENSDADSSNALIYGEFDNGVLTFNGKVGIKTTIPDVPLHVIGGTDASLSDGGYIVSGQVNSNNVAIDDNEIMARDNGQPNNLHINRDGDNVIFNEFAGSVGIGQPSPLAKLHVNGAIKLGSGVRDYEFVEVDPSYPDGWSALISYGGIGIGSNDGNNRQMFMFTDGSTTDNIFTVATSQNNGASWEADLVIRQDGNIGINTYSPARKLHINDVMRLEPRTSAPSSADEGDLYFDGTTKKLRCYDGSQWQDCW